MPKRGSKVVAARLSRLQGAAIPGSLASWAARFLESLSVRQYAVQTVGQHETHLGLFIGWCEARAVLCPREVTRPILERYQRHLFYVRRAGDRPLTAWAQKTRLVSIRSFFKWLTKQNVILSNPASELELPKVVQRLPRYVLSVREVEAVLSVPDVREALGVRDRAILEVLYSTAMRRSELLGLSVYDLDAARGTVLIREGKGKRDRVVPIGERALAWVEKYLYEVRPELVCGIDEGVLFLTNTGEAFTPGRLTQMVRRRVRAAELGKSGSCHLFRHTAATLMLEGGADIRFIQALLGHASVATTQIYTQVSIQKLQAVHRATHPGASLERPARADELESDDEARERTALLFALAAESADESESVRS